ncbi:COR domain-containing protein [Candidatus Thiosymbion oneisti]|uniref:COR domain-containing protein n=1 Tax=Candidatus Thiosymbion oneisti TaxID=589554 RepID=UPI0015B593D3|nr:COR domain-containing protein [Candidatus Thiosymbion oneisti]
MSNKLALGKIKSAIKARADRLDLSNMNLEELPADIGDITTLTALDLSSNRLSKLPASIGNLKNLNHLWLYNNNLRFLPAELSNLDKLSTFAIDRNPLPDSLITTAKRGTQDALTYLKSLYGGAEELYEAKLVLVGEGAVGKSSLVSALKGERFIENRATTHGIEITSLSVPYPASHNRNINLNVWDFGGQAVYRISHQFFYSKRSLYLLLWSPRLGVEQCDVLGWLNRIKIRVGSDASVLVVSTHCNTGGRVARIDKSQILDEYGDIIQGFCEVDSKDNTGIRELKIEIATAASRLPQMGDLLSEKWTNARNDILGLLDPYISFDRFDSVCRNHKIEPDASFALAMLMHDLGYIIYYGDDDGLKKEVVLQPEWLTKAIGYVLEDRKTNEEYGVLFHSRLIDIWDKSVSAGGQKYPPGLHSFFLRLMEKYDVSYRLPGEKSSLVAQLVPSEKPNNATTSFLVLDPTDAVIHIVCEMENSPPGLIPWLIVRTHQFTPTPRMHWEKGMALQYREHGRALIELKGADLHMMIGGRWPNYYMGLLRHILENLIGERWPGLEYRLSVPCPVSMAGKQCKGRLPLETLQNLKRKGTGEVHCLSCSSSLNIDKLLTGFSQPHIRNLESQLIQLDDQLSNLSSEVAGWFGSLLNALNHESKEHPRLCTITPNIPNKKGKEFTKLLRNAAAIEYRLNLWCEMPGCQHPICSIGSGGDGEYEFSKPKDWVVKIAPYLKVIIKTLKVTIPFLQISEYLDKDSMKKAKSSLDLLNELTASFIPDEITRDEDSTKVLTKFEGAALRELGTLLLDLDPSRTWGNMRRTILPTGDYIWVCGAHYRELNPDPPKI